MELHFEKEMVSCLNTPVQEVQNSEQTQEIKLPDGMPDIGRIVCAWGQVILRGKEWRSDSISISAGMMVWVLYVPEDGTGERCIDTWIPFQMRWDLPEQTDEGKIRVRLLTRFVDARNSSPRKIMVRAGVAAYTEAFVPESRERFVPPKEAEGAELLRSTYPVRLPAEAGEKTFLMDEDLTVPDSVPHPEKMIYYRLRPEILDKKVLANKAVFRGNGNLHVLYRSEEGQLHNWDFELPFSQFAQLEQEHSSEAQIDFSMSPTSLEVELDDEGHIRLKCGIVAQYLITDKQLLELVEDAYSPSREMTMEQEDLELPVVLENRRENIYGEQMLPADANIVVDTNFLPDFPRLRRMENGVEAELPGVFQVLYYGEDGTIRSGTVRWEGHQTWNADPNSRLSLMPMPTDLGAVIGNGQIAMKAELPVEITTTAKQRFPMVTGLELGDQRRPDPGRPTLILRRTGQQRLWDIAKSSGSTVEAIRKANQLQEEPAPDQMLLIPVS